MKIAITGAAGALGEAVAVAAAEAGHTVFAYRHADVDIGIAATIERALRRDKPEVLINCAGIIDRSADASLMLWVNAYGPRILAMTCEAAGVHLIHVSTDCVFRGDRPMVPSEYNGPSGPYPVGHEVDAAYSDIYGATKALGEQMQIRLGGSTIVRTSFISIRNGLIPWLRGEAKARRPVDGWKAAWWSGSSARYCAQALIGMAEEPPMGIVHLATARPMVKYEVLVEIARHCGLNVEIRPQWDVVLNRALQPTHLLPPLDETLRWPG
jgi:dTDP-4-dehydrorhamnose reductase